ncbi:MAG TPA: sigma 54-interacting transcriptional regulator [Polyangia bacterium]|nr:sigma 54-interacting transcriptional regulator [Polyangia bacterium]
MSHDAQSISRTVRRQLAGTREPARLPFLQVIGNGGSLDSLRAARGVAFNDSIVIGRRPPPEGEDPRGSLVLSDATVSGAHARISRGGSGDEFVIQDLGSTNGTSVGGRRIEGPTRLPSGSLIFLGSHVLHFRTITPVEMVALREDAARPLAPVPTLSPALALTATKLRLLARSSAEILIVGETGAGKEVFATAVHQASGRTGKLVPVNCAAIPKELVESELFGYEKGAHSTAQARKTGLVEAANGGTLFLDELGDMPLELQSKLLRFLQDKRFSPLGSTRVIEADVRVIAATSRSALEKGGNVYVQEALLGRLGAQPISLPPLRERIEDVGRLAAFFLDQAGDPRGFEPEAFQALLLHGWPLNVRELSKVIGEASVLSRGAPAIGLEHLPDAVTVNLQIETDELEEPAPKYPDEATHVDLAPAGHHDGAADDSRVREFSTGPDTSQTRDGERRKRRPAPTPEELTTLLAACEGSVAEVARRLDRQYAVVWRCIQRYGIDANAYRPGGGDRDG